MGLWNFFKKKKKVQSGVCFSNEKSSIELVKNFLETYADEIITVSTEDGNKLTEKTRKFYFMLETGKMLLWILSLIDIEFEDFNTFCDVSDGLKYEKLKSFARKCEIRPQNKILDMLDYTYRLNWANVEIKLKGYDRIVNESIMYFSRLTLEWVV